MPVIRATREESFKTLDPFAIAADRHNAGSFGRAGDQLGAGPQPDADFLGEHHKEALSALQGVWLPGQSALASGFEQDRQPRAKRLRPIAGRPPQGASATTASRRSEQAHVWN